MKNFFTICAICVSKKEPLEGQRIRRDKTFEKLNKNKLKKKNNKKVLKVLFIKNFRERKKNIIPM